MKRFITLSLFFILTVGLVLHFNVELPSMLQWAGKIPGDILIKKGSLLFYFPVATAVIISLILSFLLSFLFGSEK
jgi:hypothetical protein